MFAPVAWLRASSDFRGGQTDCTSGWKELLSHVVKGHSEKSASLPTGPRKAMINQEKNTWSEGHTLETLRQSDIWPSVH